MTVNPLDAGHLLETVLQVLPSGAPGRLNNPQDALAALSHTILASLGFRLINLGEGKPVRPVSEATETTAIQIPQDWNSAGPDLYTFGYRHDQSSLEFVVKLVKMAGRILVTASAVEHNRTAVWEIVTADFTSQSFFPYSPESSESSIVTQLANGFISSNRAQDFATEFDRRIIREILPGLRKDGYEAPEPSSPEPSILRHRRDEVPPRGEPFHPRNPPASPLSPAPDDPTLPEAPYQPFGLGRRDLDPFAANPLPPPGGRGGSGFRPPPLFGGGGGGGMLVGPDDPLFRGRFPSGPSGTGLPPGAVPPGARFDPIFPGGQRFPQGPGGPGRGFPRPPLGGDPDFDDFPPPRNSDYDNMFG